jgi:hypothetical protein
MADRNIPSSGAPLLVGNLFRVSTKVANEERLRAHVQMELFAAAEDVLEALGINGDFQLMSSIDALVGRPDFAWVSGPTIMQQPKLVVRSISPEPLCMPTADNRLRVYRWITRLISPRISETYQLFLRK